MLLAVAAFLLTNPIIAQFEGDDIDQRLIDVYGESRVSQMVTEQPQFVDYMNFYVRNGYKIMTNVPARKLPYFEDISTITNTRTGNPVTVNDLENLNILLLNIKRKNDEYLTFKVGETGTVVIFIAPKNLVEEFQDSKKR